MKRNAERKETGYKMINVYQETKPLLIKKAKRQKRSVVKMLDEFSRT